MKNRKTLILLTVAFSIGCNVYSQEIADNVQPKNKITADNFKLNEIVHLSTDKDIYIAGEKISISAATFDALLKIPVDLSKVLYIELYDQENIPIVQEKFILENGKGSGNIQIPKDLESNYYYLRAYTNYMKNYGAYRFSTSQISIVNPFKEMTPKIYSGDKENKVELNIFPEGGKLVAGIESKVLVKITDSKGEKKDYNGIITDETTGQQVAAFTASELGFGLFRLKPQRGHTYSAKIRTGEKQVTCKISSLEEEGATLSFVNLTDKFIHMNISVSHSDLLPVKLEDGYGIFEYSIENGIISDSLQLSIPIDQLPAGFNDFILKDKSDHILASRTIYIPEAKHINISVKNLKEAYGPREKIDLSIVTTDDTGNPVPAELTMSVNLSENQMIKNATDYTLESRLSNYFRNYDPEIFMKLKHDIDFLQTALITAQQTETPEENTSNLKTEYLAETSYDIITGTLTDIGTQQPVPGQKIYQSSIDSVIWLNTCITDSTGRFVFTLENKRPVNQLILRTKDQNRNYSIAVDDEFYNGYPNARPLTFFPEKKMLKLIEKSMINEQIDDAYNKYEIKNDSFLSPAINFFGYPDNRYYFGDYIKLPTTEEFIFEIVKEAIIIRRKKEVLIRIISAEFDVPIGDNPLFLVDGIPYLSSKEILDVDPEVLRWVEIVNHRYIYMHDYYDGIMNFKTLSGNYEELDLPKNTIRMTFIPAKKYMENGSQYQLPGKNTPYYKNLLYWNPNIKTGKNGTATITFYAPDNDGIYYLNCSGYDSNGYWGTNSKTFISGTVK